MENIPKEIREKLEDSLTERGIQQWWTGSNRLLGGLSAKELWPKDPEQVLSAADSWSEGYYV